MDTRKSIFIALALLCCTSCSTVSLGYNYGDWLLRYWINGYTSFNSAQQDQIHIEVDAYMRWHRHQALPQYTQFLQNLNGAVNQDGGLTAEEVASFRTESLRLYQVTLAPMILPAAKMLVTLDSQQIAELGNTFAKKNQTQREEMLQGNEPELLMMRAKRHVELVEQLVGRLNADQEAQITAMSLNIPFATNHYIEHREAKEFRLIEMLNRKDGEEIIAALFKQWIEAPDVSRSAQQQQVISAYESAMNEMTAKIFGLLTARQKHQLSRMISSYIDDFQEINSVDAAYDQPGEK